ncbi:hypothetical protein HS088_TW07G00078 [Tripterygium wilfordii]|uniref:DUF1771 domain-containing protein n=1 Tax=Tripterygium wilfordii TaxID=458696 RepID=A0A7J7DEL0_TRIWF|nr:hypothetical protein HS088_TW07G00078 [Tripterygium wilfordii]
MHEICRVIFVDVQALIRGFGGDDGTVSLVNLKEGGFYRLLPRIGVLKASSEEAVFVDVEEVRKLCCVVVTNGKDGCKVYWRDGELQIASFLASQQDPTGAGDIFLGGFVAGLVQGLSVPDAALVGNFFGSLGVERIGLPKFDLRMLQSTARASGCTSHSSQSEFHYFRMVAAKGDEYQVLRKGARQHWDSMRSCYQKAAAAYSDGKKEYAAYLSDQGKLQTKLAQEADEKSSQGIFKARKKRA